MPNFYRARGWIEFDDEDSAIRDFITGYYSSLELSIYLQGWQMSNYEFNNCSYIFYGLQTKISGAEVLLSILRDISNKFTDIQGEFTIEIEYDVKFRLILSQGHIESQGNVPPELSKLLRQNNN